MHEEQYLYWLSTLYRLGSRKLNQLFEHFGSAKAVYDASPQVLQAGTQLSDYALNLIIQSRSREYIDNGLRSLEKHNLRFISRFDEAFPILLKDIPDPPIGLYVLGTLPSEDFPRVAVIGSRRCSDYGRSIARKIGNTLGASNVVTVSGMAMGIDSMAHRGALEAGGETIAVLGCGADICYPKTNRALRDEIIQNGCVVSEYPTGVQPMPAHFPARNRIISGLSSVLVVVEAGKRSGTLITVEQALDQGRDVMAVPGNITGKYSEGTNALIKQGAEPAASPEDILHMLGMNLHDSPQKPKSGNDNHIAPEEKLVYDVLAFEPIGLDELIDKTKALPQDVQYILTMLEVKGFIRRLPGMRYARRL